MLSATARSLKSTSAKISVNDKDLTRAATSVKRRTAECKGMTGRQLYLTIIGLLGAGGGSAAGVIAKVSHTFQPSGRCAASNSL